MLEKISLERLQEIDELRNITMGNIHFQIWMKEMKVGRLVVKHKDRASEIMASWCNEEGVPNSFNYVIDNLK